jgi:hypothetical protein
MVKGHGDMSDTSPTSPAEPDTVRRMIWAEAADDVADVRNRYLQHFRGEVEQFCDAMTSAYAAWRELDGKVRHAEPAYVSALIFSAINLNIASMRLLVGGYQVAAGGVHRQVLETLALAILCSSPSLDIRARFIAGKYSTNKAIRDLLRHASTLRLNETSIKVLERSRDFLHNFSHPSLLSLATLTSFSGEGIYLGAAFDLGKIESYRKEVKALVSLASVLGNMIAGVRDQMGV